VNLCQQIDRFICNNSQRLDSHCLVFLSFLQQGLTSSGSFLYLWTACYLSLWAWVFLDVAIHPSLLPTLFQLTFTTDGWWWEERQRDRRRGSGLLTCPAVSSLLRILLMSYSFISSPPRRKYNAIQYKVQIARESFLLKQKNLSQRLLYWSYYSIVIVVIIVIKVIIKGHVQPKTKNFLIIPKGGKWEKMTICRSQWVDYI